MNSQTACPDLLIAIQSEAYGEASFRSAHWLSCGSKKAKAQALWQLEHQTKGRVTNYFKHHNLAVPNLTLASLKGRVIGLIFPVFPWRWVMKILLSETAPYLTVFKRLQAGACAQDRAFFDYLVDHEMALQKFAQLELDGRQAEALEAITALLD